MNAFFAGVVFGALFAGSAFTIFLTRIRRPKRREIEPWSETAYQVPVVTTTILVNKRKIEI